jgi:hypothetical protein
MQFWLEESTLAEEFWPLKGASWCWLPQISAASEASGPGLYTQSPVEWWWPGFREGLCFWQAQILVG